jgi:hypothetical protein
LRSFSACVAAVKRRLGNRAASLASTAVRFGADQRAGHGHYWASHQSIEAPSQLRRLAVYVKMDPERMPPSILEDVEYMVTDSELAYLKPIRWPLPDDIYQVYPVAKHLGCSGHTTSYASASA